MAYVYLPFKKFVKECFNGFFVRTDEHNNVSLVLAHVPVCNTQCPDKGYDITNSKKGLH